MALARTQTIERARGIATRRAKAPAVYLALGALLIAAFVLSLGLGSVEIPVSETVAILLGHVGLADAHGVPGTHEKIIAQVRLPRVLAAALVGWILAISGAVMQGVFRNPLASPYLLGIASGASVGAALVIVLGLRAVVGTIALPLGAFLGAMLAVTLIYLFAYRRGRGAPGLSLILAGIALGALCSAITSFLIFMSGKQMQEIIFWIMGSLGRVDWSYLGWLFPVALAGAAILIYFARDLNALSLGDEGAFHLGIRPEPLKRLLLVVVTLITGAAVAVAGTIGFVGLIVPHALRLIVGPDHRILLGASAITGAVFLMLSDAAARTLIEPVELPVGILTALIGAPVFLYLLMTRARVEMR